MKSMNESVGSAGPRRGQNDAAARLITAGGKVVGEVRRGIFHKRVKSSVHFLRTPYGIASNVDSLQQAVEAGATTIQLFDTDTGNEYRTTIRHLRERGENLRRGHGGQLFLPMLHWEKREGAGSTWTIQQHDVTNATPDFRRKTCALLTGFPGLEDGRERYPMCARAADVFGRLADGSVNFYCDGCAEEVHLLVIAKKE